MTDVLECNRCLGGNFRQDVSQLFPCDTGKMAFFDGFSLQMAFSPYRVGKSHLAGGKIGAH